MSILTEFLDTYKPVQTIRLPLSAYLYKSDAVSGLARLTSDQIEAISSLLSNYETHEELSTSVDTNKLSAGILSVDTAIFSVEHIDGYQILNINGTRFYNIGDKQVVQSVLPRRDLDARVTVFRDPASGHYFRLVALVDDKSMIDPDADVNFNIDVVRISPADIDQNNDEIYDRVYIRVPGENERYSVKYLYIGFSSTGEPRLEACPAVDDLDFKLGEVVDSIFFTGDTIQTNGSYAPERIAVTYDGNQHLWPLADSEYSQRIVEDEMRVFNSRTNSRVDSVILSVNSVNSGLSTFRNEVANEIIAIQDAAAELKASMLSSFDVVENTFARVDRDIGVIDAKADMVNERVTALSSEVNRIDSDIAAIRSDVENMSAAITRNTAMLATLIDRVSNIAQPLSDCTVEDERVAINNIISAFATPISE